LKTFHEVIEAGLLRQKVVSGRLGGFFLQCEMHAFVATILLRMSRLDAFDGDAQAKPPDSEFADVEQSMRGGEGHSVITATLPQVSRILKVAGRAVCIAFSVCCRVLPYSKTRNNLEQNRRKLPALARGRRFDPHRSSAVMWATSIEMVSPVYLLSHQAETASNERLQT